MFRQDDWDGLGRAFRSDRFRDLARREPETHQFLVTLVAQPSVQDVLEELESSDDALNELRSDPNAFLASRGINIPPNRQVVFQEVNSWFLGFEDSAGGRFGYEGGQGGRGWVCGEKR